MPQNILFQFQIMIPLPFFSSLKYSPQQYLPSGQKNSPQPFMRPSHQPPTYFFPSSHSYSPCPSYTDYRNQPKYFSQAGWYFKYSRRLLGEILSDFMCFLLQWYRVPEIIFPFEYLPQKQLPEACFSNPDPSFKFSFHYPQQYWPAEPLYIPTPYFLPSLSSPSYIYPEEYKKNPHRSGLPSLKNPVQQKSLFMQLPMPFGAASLNCPLQQYYQLGRNPNYGCICRSVLSYYILIGAGLVANAFEVKSEQRFLNSWKVMFSEPSDAKGNLSST